MSSNKNLLIIFTRNPELGKVKTRLAKEVGDRAALDIYKFLLRHTVFIAKDLECDKSVYYSEEIHHGDIWEEAVFQKELQQGEDLGSRMKNAFEEGFKSGYKSIIIIGSDMYDLAADDLRKAFSMLENNEFVIGPAEDGGYYLLGMNRMESSVFKNKNWGTSTVLQQTLNNLKDRNIKLLEERNDVDYYQDIKHHPDFQEFFQHINL